MTASTSAKPSVIDAHHHLWRYTAHEYGWIEEGMLALQRDFLPDDLVAELSHAGVDGAIVVQARQTVAETHWLLELAKANEPIRGVIGWADIAAPNFESSLSALAVDPRLVGLRHVVQAEADGFLDTPAFNRGITTLRQAGLVYDLLLSEAQLWEATRFVDRHPQQIFVLDHMAKPRIAAREIEPWRTNLLELSQRSNVYCKVSGMVTEDSWSNWSLDSLKPYLDIVVEAFGVTRLMAGSDWPVCLLASGYSRWWAVLQNYFANFSEEERAGFFGANAIGVYHLT
jgi:L-fuconolactonase